MQVLRVCRFSTFSLPPALPPCCCPLAFQHQVRRLASRISSESYPGYPECVVSCHGAERLANSIPPFFATVPFSHTTTLSAFLAGFGLLTGSRVRDITSSSSWRPVSADNLLPSKEGEELTLSSGYEVDNDTAHPCTCGAKHCCGYLLAPEYWDRLKPTAPRSRCFLPHGE
jgi:hypothetical protein